MHSSGREAKFVGRVAPDDMVRIRTGY
jgi:hypothetical protein